MVTVKINLISAYLFKRMQKLLHPLLNENNPVYSIVIGNKPACTLTFLYLKKFLSMVQEQLPS